MPEVYDIVFKLTAVNEVGRVLTELSRHLIQIGREAEDAAVKLAALGQGTASFASAMKGLALIGGGASLLVGGGILAGVDLLANKYDRMLALRERFAQAGMQEIEIDKLLETARKATIDSGLVSWEKNVELAQELNQVTKDIGRTTALLPLLSKYQGVMGEEQTKGLLDIARITGLGTPQKEADFKTFADTAFRVWESTFHQLGPAEMAKQFQMLRSSRVGLSPEFFTEFAAIQQSMTASGGGGRFGAGRGFAAEWDKLVALHQEFTEAERKISEGKKEKLSPRMRSWLEMGIPEGILGDFGRDPYQFAQKIAPAFIHAAGISIRPGQPLTQMDEKRAAELAGKLWGGGGAGDAFLQSILGGPALRRMQGLPGLSPIESFMAGQARALSIDETEKALLGNSPEKVREAIKNKMGVILNEISEPLNKIKLEWEKQFLGGVLKPLELWINNQPAGKMDEWAKAAVNLGVSLGELGAALIGVVMLKLVWSKTAGLAFLLTELASVLMVFHRDMSDKDWKATFNNIGTSLAEGLFGPSLVQNMDNTFANAIRAVGWEKASAEVKTNMEGLQKVAVTSIDQWMLSLLPRWLRNAIPVPGAGERERPFFPPGFSGGPTGPGSIPLQYGRRSEPSQPFDPSAGTGRPPAPRPRGLFDNLFGGRRSEDEGLANALRSAVFSAAQQNKEPRPIVVSLNIDGRRISEVLSTSLASLMEFPGQAPMHNGWAGAQGPDMQWPT